MSSPAQIIANRTNAQSSTGPRTPDGKQNSSRNAATHALTGGFRVLPHEDQQAFDKSLAGYLAEFKPGGEHETFLVERMAQSRWELKRINRLQVEVVARITQAAGGASSPDGAIAAALIAKTADAFTTLQRYAAAAERSYLRCHHELMQGRSQEKRQHAREMEAMVHAAALMPCPFERPERNEPKPTATATAKPIPGVSFTDADPLSWRL